MVLTVVGMWMGTFNNG
jgi:hypothetical protein